MYEDKKMVCVECSDDFVFTADEQSFYAEKGFQNEPSRCKPCRIKKKKRMNDRGGKRGGGGGGGFKQTYSVQCAACGIETDVPFKPTGVRPVLCRSCFESKKNEGNG